LPTYCRPSAPGWEADELLRGRRQGARRELRPGQRSPGGPRKSPGIAPTALYRLFPSKDALVAAYVERTEYRYREWFEAVTVDDGRSAAERIDALFEALSEQTRPGVCRGCPFMMALTEFPTSRSLGIMTPSASRSGCVHGSGSSPKSTPPRTPERISTPHGSPTISSCFSRAFTPPCRPSDAMGPPSAPANSQRR
jgi:AcrR family transcriptional regulator